MRTSVALVCYFIVNLLGNTLKANARAPTIISFAPNPICQGETITINGSGFTGATNVIVGNLFTGSFTVKDDNTITAVVPAAALFPVRSSVGIGRMGILSDINR